MNSKIKMMKTLVVVGALMAGLSRTAVAQSNAPVGWTPQEVASLSLPDFRYVVRPVPGVYFDPSQSGTGLTVDTLPVSGQTTVFATYYHYDADGAATWLNMIAPVTPASTAEYTVDGVPATVRSRWIASTGGQCFDCAYSGYAASYPPYGDRTLNVMDGRLLQMPASGNAPVRNMQLGKTAQPAADMSLALLESGAVWQSRSRNYSSQGVENAFDSAPRGLGGLVRFARRDPSKKWTYVAPYTASEVQDGQGGFVPATAPAWLDVPNINTIATQYQIEVLKVGADVGFGHLGGVTYDPPYQELANGAGTSTFVIHPQTGAIHGITHGTVGVSFSRDNASPRNASYLTWAGTTDEGQPRLIIRTWSRLINAWYEEIELTRVSDDYRKLVLPNYVPNANPRPLF